jgi:hypothetical protein
MGSIPYLLAYRCVAEDLELIMIGPHENYYGDLKKNPKNMSSGHRGGKCPGASLP